MNLLLTDIPCIKIIKNMNDHYVKILGARGSVPVSGKEFMQFGGATSSFLVNLSGTVLVVDAGSGLCKLTKDISELNRLDLLLTHLHLDHLLGLPLCPFILQKNKNLTIHMPESWSQDAEERLMRLFSPPFWPVTLNDLPAKIKLHRIKEKDYINCISVETMHGIHPGGVEVYKISNSQKSVVIATDCTLTDSFFHDLEVFAENCDLLLIDGQYSDLEWTEKYDYGHSKWSKAALLGKISGAKQVRIIHHDPAHSDDILLAAEKEMKDYPGCFFAREDEIIPL